VAAAARAALTRSVERVSAARLFVFRHFVRQRADFLTSVRSKQEKSFYPRSHTKPHEQEGMKEGDEDRDEHKGLTNTNARRSRRPDEFVFFFRVVSCGFVNKVFPTLIPNARFFNVGDRLSRRARLETVGALRLCST